jgi:hypothetical protein
VSFNLTKLFQSFGNKYFFLEKEHFFLSKSSAREKNLDLHFAINISGNSPFGTPALTKNAERYKW